MAHPSGSGSHAGLALNPDVTPTRDRAVKRPDAEPVKDLTVGSHAGRPPASRTPEFTRNFYDSVIGSARLGARRQG
jgi:hypothetical protein